MWYLPPTYPENLPHLTIRLQGTADGSMTLEGHPLRDGYTVLDSISIETPVFIAAFTFIGAEI